MPAAGNQRGAALELGELDLELGDLGKIAARDVAHHAFGQAAAIDREPPAQLLRAIVLHAAQSGRRAAAAP